MTLRRHVVLPRGCDAVEAARILAVAAERAGGRFLVEPATSGPRRSGRIIGARGVIAVDIAPGRTLLAWEPADRWSRLHGPGIADDFGELLRER